MIRGLFLEDLSLWGCVWQSALFAVIGLAGSFLLRCRPARASQVLFLAIIAAVLLPTMSVLVRHFGLGLFTEEPIALPPFEIELSTETPKILLAPEIQPAALEVPTDFALAESGSEDVRIPWRLIALYGWMIATLILLGRLFAAFVSGICLLRRAQSDGCEHIRGAANAARARLGITKGLQIRSSEEVRSPMIWCWSRRGTKPNWCCKGSQNKISAGMKKQKCIDGIWMNHRSSSGRRRMSLAGANPALPRITEGRIWSGKFKIFANSSIVSMSK